MGCSSSKTEEAASVQICRDRKNFIKQAIKHLNQLSSSHVAYVQSLRRLSVALCTYVDENRYQYLLDSYIYHPYRYNKIFIEPNITNASVTVHFSRSQPKLPKTASTKLETNTITFVDDRFTTNVYPNTLTSMNKDEHMDMKEAGCFLEKESSQDDRYKSTSTEKGLEDGDKGSVLQERRNRVVIGSGDLEEQMPGFTVHVSRVPASMLEVMKDVEAQFTAICDAATEVASLLEVNIINNHSNRDRTSQLIDTALRDGSNSNSDASDEPFELFKSHKASLERLYAWEKKLYEEVKLLHLRRKLEMPNDKIAPTTKRLPKDFLLANYEIKGSNKRLINLEGERIRVSYEKKFAQLKNQDITGAEPSSVEKTRASIRDLRTRLNLSSTSVETISKRIETLRDEELYPRVTELFHALAKFWQAMANSHRIQKHTLSQAKLLLQLLTSTTSPPPPVAAAASLASELRHWRLSLSDWTASQRAYATDLSNWATSCVSDPAQGGAMLRNCTKWAKMMESVDERKAGEGIARLEERMKVVATGGKRRQRGGEEWEEEDWRKAICDGVANVVAVVGDAAAEAAVAYENLVRKWRDERMGREGDD